VASTDNHHGTAVLGQLAAVANTYGVTGIAHGAQVGVQSTLIDSPAAAVNSAAIAVGRGGVVVIAVERTGPADSTPCTCNVARCHSLPVEYWQGEYDVIDTATANGVVVVEVAGDGSANLDDAAYSGRFNRTIRDSGAILVGASQGSSRAPLCWTNYGSRVDMQGWGANVTTLGYGDLFGSAYGKDQYYTGVFGGTSSAAPMVAGAAASVQGVALADGREALEPRTLRALLASTGTPQAADPRNIGPLPNLREAIKMLPFAPRKVSTLEDTSVSFSLPSKDMDGNPLFYSVVQQPAHGALRGRPPFLTYQPSANFHGSDAVSFQAGNGGAVLATATVNFTVVPVNDAPVA
jgi:serine protease